MWQGTIWIKPLYPSRLFRHPCDQVEEVSGGFDPADYASEVIWAPESHDGASVPVSVAYRR